MNDLAHAQHVVDMVYLIFGLFGGWYVLEMIVKIINSFLLKNKNNNKLVLTFDYIVISIGLISIIGVTVWLVGTMFHTIISSFITVYF